jgi:FAD/FMN-containing dehydrogenase
LPRSHRFAERADRPGRQGPYLTDWRRRYTGDALAVLRPGSTEEVAAVMRACHAHKLAVVPQGGNTGLCGGATPEPGDAAARGTVVLSLQRMNRVRQVDPLNNTITVEAGVILQQLQEAAQTHGRLFPLSLAAEGSCTIGGNLSTNAGGTAVLRYGNTRELCLGLEVVNIRARSGTACAACARTTPATTCATCSSAPKARSASSPAVMKLFRRRARGSPRWPPLKPTRRAGAAGHRAIARGRHADRFRVDVRDVHGSGDEALPAVALPVHRPSSATRSAGTVRQRERRTRADDLRKMMEVALEAGVVKDAVVAESVQQSRDFWNLREHIPLAQVEEGKNIKHDIAVPISRVADFIETTDTLLQDAFPGARMVTFGHLGDGNLHYNVSPPVGVDHDQFLSHQDAINLIVHNSVHVHNGSISAEHGLGQLKREENRRYKSEVELAMMRAIKQALDPQGLMNPGKVV